MGDSRPLVGAGGLRVGAGSDIEGMEIIWGRWKSFGGDGCLWKKSENVCFSQLGRVKIVFLGVGGGSKK